MARRSGRRRDPWQTPMLVVVGGFAVAAVVYSYIGAPGPAAPARVSTPAAVTVKAPKSLVMPATPYFAAYLGFRFRLPIPADAVTALAFHQASLDHAVSMTSLVRGISRREAAHQAEMIRARRGRLASATVEASGAAGLAEPQSRTRSAYAFTATGIWDGRALRMWRSGRTGKPDTAVDVGAPAGTPVLSPVDGTVVCVRRYKLYGKHPDFEIHISPDAMPDMDVVLIHVTDVTAFEGERVHAGVTRVASVRSLSALTGLQLAEYTADGGNHTHMQVNRVPSPGMLWVSSSAGPISIRSRDETSWVPEPPLQQ